MTISEHLIQPLVTAAIDILKTKLSFIFKDDVNKLEDIHTKLSAHLTEVANWSTFIQVFGVAAERYTDRDTIRLDLCDIPRKFRNQRTSAATENIFLEGTDHFLLLGDPGSGKTTTVKRLIRKLLLTAPESQKETCQYPILLILREYDTSLSLHMNIAATLGIHYQLSGDPNFPQNAPSEKQVSVGDENIDFAIPHILDSTNAVLFLDGLDEVHSGYFDQLVSEIERLARRLTASKIIVTCRSGGYTKLFEGFKIYEIAELTDPQVEKIAKIWVSSPKLFLDKLNKLPYRDLVNRPLLLTQLLSIFNYEGALPEQPYLIYKKTIRLLLESWDRTRGVNRNSKYARFDPEIKLEFLSALSYELTYKVKTKRFSEDDLLKCYKNICQKYHLPEREAFDVAGEIETHNGIIVATGNFAFEFSHLSLQEYLCANYLVREPFSAKLKSYLREYPAPVAVAVALSSEPSTWFAGLILNYGNYDNFNDASLGMFIKRILLERPSFVTSSALGYAILKLYFDFFQQSSDELKNNLEYLLRTSGVEESVALSLRPYCIVKDESDRLSDYFAVIFQHEVADQSVGSECGFQRPSRGLFPKKLLIEIVRKHSVRMRWIESCQSRVSNWLTIASDGYFYSE